MRPSPTPTTHDTNTRDKLTIVTILSFSERLAIANLSLSGESNCYRQQSQKEAGAGINTPPQTKSLTGVTILITVSWKRQNESQQETRRSAQFNLLGGTYLLQGVRVHEGVHAHSVPMQHVQ